MAIAGPQQAERPLSARRARRDERRGRARWFDVGGGHLHRSVLV